MNYNIARTYELLTSFSRNILQIIEVSQILAYGTLAIIADLMQLFCKETPTEWFITVSLPFDEIFNDSLDIFVCCMNCMTSISHGDYAIDHQYLYCYSFTKFSSHVVNHCRHNHMEHLLLYRIHAVFCILHQRVFHITMN